MGNKQNQSKKNNYKQEKLNTDSHGAKGNKVKLECDMARPSLDPMIKSNSEILETIKSDDQNDSFDNTILEKVFYTDNQQLDNEENLLEQGNIIQSQENQEMKESSIVKQRPKLQEDEIVKANFNQQVLQNKKSPFNQQTPSQRVYQYENNIYQRNQRQKPRVIFENFETFAEERPKQDNIRGQKGKNYQLYLLLIFVSIQANQFKPFLLESNYARITEQLESKQIQFLTQSCPNINLNQEKSLNSYQIQKVMISCIRMNKDSILFFYQMVCIRK